MILAIDTSAARSALALLEGDQVLAEVVKTSGQEFDVAAEASALLPEPKRLQGVLIAVGPGSFTGLRQGISFGVGLAMGLRVPLLGVGSLELTAARARVPATAVIEAGRGRVFYLTPAGERGAAEIGALPAQWPVVGWLKSSPPGLIPESEQVSFGAAVREVEASARRVAYGTVKADYMQDFGQLN